MLFNQIFFHRQVRDLGLFWKAGEFMTPNRVTYWYKRSIALEVDFP